VSARRAGLWDPVNGDMISAETETTEDGRKRMGLQLGPHGSIFVVFHHGNGPDNLSELAEKEIFESISIQGPWTVRFQKGRGAPESVKFKTLKSWTASSVPGIRYFSGTAEYKAEFNLPDPLSGNRILLELGEVREVATVKVNGIECGTLWTKPFSVDITSAIRPGKNGLEIGVTNLWPNRLIGDQFLPESKRIGFTNIQFFKKNSPLLKSGLLGPVTIQIHKDK
jgi:hypothetical protein